MGEPPKPRVTRPGGFELEETTEQNEPSAELLDSLRDAHERITTRLPGEPRPTKHDETTVRRRIIVGPDGVPQVLEHDDDETDEATRRHPAAGPPATGGDDE